MDLVLKLRELRALRGLSQKDVARLSGVGEKTISSFETGQRIGSLKLSQLRRLLDLYGVTEEEFFSRKLDQLFDPDTVEQQSRGQALLAGLEALPREMRDALLERFELMLHAAQLAVASTTPHRSTPPVPSLSRPAAHARVHAPAA
ncbi:MAG: helix-turn-helix transcriptional regulator [Thermoanaerobaculia bacterium]